MRIFHGFDIPVKLKNPVVTVGSYDGVHKGHRELLARITGLAREKNGESVVVTFSPHPRRIVGDRQGVKLLSSDSEKAVLLEKAGVDNLVIVPFTEEFSRLPFQDFIRDHLVAELGVSTLVVGYNHHFGHNRQGDFNSLDRLGEELGFETYMVPRLDVDSHKVSSTVIRDLIGSGMVARAEPYLGYRYFITGCVVSGDRFVPEEADKLLPPAGKYQVEVSSPAGTETVTMEISGDGNITLPVSWELPGPRRAVVTFC